MLYYNKYLCVLCCLKVYYISVNLYLRPSCDLQWAFKLNWNMFAYCFFVHLVSLTYIYVCNVDTYENEIKKKLLN